MFSLKSNISKEFWIVGGLLLAGLLVRLYHLEIPSLQLDELKTAMRSNHSFLETLNLIRHSAFPPLYYALMNLWVGIFGNSEWALRLPSAVFSGMTVIVIYKLGRDLFNKDVGLFCALLLVFSPFAVNYAQFAKMYALFWFLSAAAFLFFWRFLKGQGARSYKFYIIASILCCYTMYTGYLLLIAQNVIFLILGEKSWRRKWFRGQGIIAAFCIPWLIWFLCSRHETLSLMRPDASFDYLGFLFQSFLYIIGSSQEVMARSNLTQLSFKLRLGQANCFLFVFLYAFSLMNVLTVGLKNRSFRRSLPVIDCFLLIWVLIPVCIYLMFDYFLFHVELAVRYIGFLQVPFILTAGRQINSLNSIIRKIGAAVMLMIAFVSTGIYFQDNADNIQQGWRQTAEELTRHLQGNDIILSAIGADPFRYYFNAGQHRFYFYRQGTER